MSESYDSESYDLIPDELALVIHDEEPSATPAGLDDLDLDGLPLNAPTNHSGRLVPSSITGDRLLVQRWLAEKSLNTRDAYSRDLLQFFEYVPVPLRYVTLGMLQEYRQYLLDDEANGGCGYATSTVARKVSAVKSLFTFGAKLQYFAHNVAAALTTPAVRGRRAERILSESDLWAILMLETDLRNHAMLRLFYASGGRRSDIMGLTWRDVKARPDLEGPDGKAGGQVTFFGKGGKTRAVTLYSRAWVVMELLREREDRAGYGAPADPVIRSTQLGSPTKNHPDGEPRALSKSQIWRLVKAAAVRAGVEVYTKTDAEGRPVVGPDGEPVKTSAVSPHWFRHAHASHALQKGADLELVRETLGHDSIETTKVYLHAQPGKSSSYYVDEAPGFRGDP